MEISSMPKEKPVLSLSVIAKNEADRIARLLLSAQSIVDEIIVVDSGSTDGTVELCRSSGATVIHQEWLGYAAQKQFAMEQANVEWILNLDADEALSKDLADEIVHALKKEDANNIAGFSIPRLSRYLDRWIRHGGWYPDRKVRLVRRGKASWVGDGIHEKLEVSGKVERLESPLLHYVYRDISDQVRTINRFSSVFAGHREKTGSGGYLFLGLVHSVGKFLECWAWKLGFLDGYPGLVIAVNSAFYVFLKHAKAWEKGRTVCGGDESSMITEPSENT
jgi:glycosyltransferase involved in cell wall biosynthesis